MRTMSNPYLLGIALTFLVSLSACEEVADSKSTGANETVSSGALPAEQATAVQSDKSDQMDQSEAMDNSSATDANNKNDEVLINQITGKWVIEKLWTDTRGVSAYILDDPSAVGSIMTITPQSIQWTHIASDQFPATDICGGPTPIIVRDPANAKATGAPFDDAIAYFAIPKNELGQIHEMACAESGNWGPEAAGGSNFYVTSGGRMIMNWYDGAYLLLKRQ